MAIQFWSALPAMLLALTGGELPAPAPASNFREEAEAAPIKEQDAEQISFEHVVIIRVPRTEKAASFSADLKQDGHKCLPASRLIGMRVSRSGALDMLTSDGWYRAHLSKGCDARQFYSGFYMEKATDGLFCSKREELRSRSGAMCQVEGFTRLSN